MRYELKLIVPGVRSAQVRLWLRLHPAGLITAYPPRWVNSLYLDTYRLAALVENLDGIAHRNKLRLRWYGEISPANLPILEMKFKRGMLGSKEQHRLTSDIDLKQSWHSVLSSFRNGLPPVWRSRFQAASQPALINRYRREYYVTADRAVRVTLDSRQVAYEQRLAGRPNLGSPLPIEDALVIEIKADQDHTDQVQTVANAFPISRTRNSKYAKGMLAMLYSL